MTEWVVEHCNKCGVEIYPYSRKYSISDNCYYCKKCATAIDKKYIEEHTCAVCKVMIKNNEPKFVVASRQISENGHELLVKDRVVCAKCHMALMSQSKMRAMPKESMKTRNGIAAYIAKRMMEKDSRSNVSTIVA
ncbi:MAG: hypothetical protein M1504_04125 [Candidatus Marsarchaeota archaeon]|nr:hypothetical protein [Candidatus Marsarchaeota archaeon]